MSDTLIVNARLVNEGRIIQGDLRVRGERIAAIGSGLPRTLSNSAARWNGRLISTAMPLSAQKGNSSRSALRSPTE